MLPHFKSGGSDNAAGGQGSVVVGGRGNIANDYRVVVIGGPEKSSSSDFGLVS